MVQGVNLSASSALHAGDVEHHAKPAEPENKNSKAGSAAAQNVDKALVLYDAGKAAKMLAQSPHLQQHAGDGGTLSVLSGAGKSGMPSQDMAEVFSKVVSLIKQYEPQLLDALRQMAGPRAFSTHNVPPRKRLPPAPETAATTAAELAESSETAGTAEAEQALVHVPRLGHGTLQRLQSVTGHEEEPSPELQQAMVRHGVNNWNAFHARHHAASTALTPHHGQTPESGPLPQFDDVFPEHPHYSDAELLAAYKVFNALQNMAMANCLELVGSQNSAQSNAGVQAYLEANPLDYQQALKAEAELHHLQQQKLQQPGVA